MSNEIANLSNSLDMWEDEQKLKDIKDIFAPKLNALEFKFFIGMGKANDLNPFLREIWAVKYADNAPAQIFIGRDGYRKSAQRHPDYKIHIVEAVYEKDEFKYQDGNISHSFGMANRGKLLGAYCKVYKKSIELPISVICELKDYSTNKSLWHAETGKQATMIKKVAEAQCLRMAFQEQYSGSYSEYENMHTIEGEVITKKSNSEKIQSLLTKKGLNNEKTIDVSSVSNNSTASPYLVDDDGVYIPNSVSTVSDIKTSNHDGLVGNGKEENSDTDSQNAPLPCTKEQLVSIDFLLDEKKVDKVGQLKILDHFKLSSYSELSERQAMAVIKKLNSME